MTDPIHPDTHLGLASLKVSNLERSLDWYQRVLGFKAHRRGIDSAYLGAGRDDLLALIEQPGARQYRGTTGLYHFAVLLPNRRELALAMARLFALRYPNAPTDHVITQTTYLDDAEGNGIELYADTPEEGELAFAEGGFVVRDARGIRRSGRDPLDLEALFRELTPGDRLDAPVAGETKLGHVHLHVANLAQAVNFYCDVLGFVLMGHAPAMGAAFVSAGGYHHHIGLNTWMGEGAPPPPPDALGLGYFTVVLPHHGALASVLDRVKKVGIALESIEAGVLVRDPSQNGVALVARPELPQFPPELEAHAKQDTQ